MPEGFSAAYQPRRRFLSGHEAQLLLAQLTPDRAARVAFILATGARWSESERAMRSDIDWRRSVVHLRGTKTAAALRAVPIVGASFDLLQHAERYAKATAGSSSDLGEAAGAISPKHASGQRETRSTRTSKALGNALMKHPKPTCVLLATSSLSSR